MYNSLTNQCFRASFSLELDLNQIMVFLLKNYYSSWSGFELENLRVRIVWSILQKCGTYQETDNCQLATRNDSWWLVLSLMSQGLMGIAWWIIFTKWANKRFSDRITRLVLDRRKHIKSRSTSKHITRLVFHVKLIA